MRASLSAVTPPTTYPVSVAEARTHVRQDLQDDDAWLQDAIIAATEMVESDTNRQLLTAVSRLSLDGVPACGWIDIPRPPLVSVSSVIYIDTAGVSQTWAATNYRVSAPTGPRCARGRVTLASGIAWPSMNSVSDALQVTISHGYGAASAVPSMLKQAIKMLVLHWYDNRSVLVIGTISKELELSYRAIVAKFLSRAEQ